MRAALRLCILCMLALPWPANATGTFNRIDGGSPVPVAPVEKVELPAPLTAPSPRIISTPEPGQGGIAPIPMRPGDPSPKEGIATPLISDIFAQPDDQGGTAILLVRANALADSAQIIFEWQEPVGYRTFEKEDRLLLEFDATAPTLPPILDSKLKQYISSIGSRTLDGHLVYTLTYPVGTKVSHRKQGHYLVVDLKRPATPPVAPTKQVQTADADTKNLATKAPRAPKPQSRALPPVGGNKPTPVRKPTPPKKQTDHLGRPVPPKSKPNTSQKPKKAPPKAPSSSKQTAEPGLKNTAPTPSGPLTPTLKAEKNTVTVTFPWKKRTAAAAYSRNGTTWVVFDRTPRIRPEKLQSKNPLFSFMEQVPNKTNTILRFANPEKLPVIMQRRKNTWTLTAGSGLAEPRPVRVELKSKSAGGRHIFIPVVGFGDPLILEDPDIGDRMVFIPIKQAGFAVTPDRQFVEFALPETAQGIVVLPRYDEVNVQPMKSGVRIVSPFGLQISPDLPLPKGVVFDDYLETGLFFPYNRWKVPDGSEFTPTRRALEQDIAAERDDDDPTSGANPFRLRLAQLYLAEGMAQEALAALRMIEQSDPAFAARRRVHALKAIAYILMDKLGSAKKELLDPSLADYDETQFLLKAVRIAANNWKPRLTLSRDEKRYYESYSPLLRRKLAFMFTEKYIRDKNYQAAIRIIDDLRVNEELGSKMNLAQYYFGQIASKTRRTEQAVELWEPLTDELADPFARFRAGLGLTRMLYQQKKITPEEAIERLENLRIVWRGDKYEEDLLRMLGQLYADTGQYEDGLRIWKELITNFRDTPTSKKVAQQMTDIFILLFNRGGVDHLSPLEALALYYKYPELLPLGKEGDEIVQKLADRLVDIDLLTRAAELLTHQVRYRLTGVDRARIGARLALIHLMNQHPDLAVQAIESTKHDKVPPTLQKTRNHLMAQALLKTGDHPRALKLVARDESDDGRQLAVEVLWAMEQWTVTANFLRSILSESPPDNPPSARDAERIMRLALADVYGSNSDGLQQSRSAFLPIMNETEYGDAFAFLTKKLSAINHTTMGRIQPIISGFETFMDTYKKRVKDEGLSEVIE